MSARYKSNTIQVKNEVHTRAAIVLRSILDDVDKTADRRTPKETGLLRRNKFKQVLGLKGTIRWNQRYAVFQEDKQYRNYTTPGTGPHFAENAVEEVVGRSDSHFRKAGISGGITARRT